MTGRIFDIQRFCIHDGPGIRSTVFLKGCFLHCKWCHNPESISAKPQLSVLADRCMSIRRCVEVCPEHALGYRGDGKVAIDWMRCTACGKCAAECDSKALEMVGRDVTVQQVMDVVLRDREYYAASGGGITLSGGEPLYQPEFCEAVLRAARQEKLHTCVETSGFCDNRILRRFIGLVDLFLYDYKETDSNLHKAFTGEPNQLILANLRDLHAKGARILLRCPMIPEYNARKEHLDGIVSIARELPNLAAVEILPYHRLGRAKLRRFGLQPTMPETVAPPDQATVEGWVKHLRKGGVRLVHSGASAEAACKELPYLCAQQPPQL